MDALLETVQAIGFAVYALPHLAATIVLAFSTQPTRIRTLDKFAACGPLLGLAMGTTIASALGHLWLTEQSFPIFAGEHRTLTVAFLVVWLSNIKLEIWTLEPFRKAETNDHYADAIPSIVRHLWFHSIAIAAVVAVSQL